MTPYDRWLTREPEGYDRFDEYDPPCPKCGHLCTDHEPMQVVDLDGNDFETLRCPEGDPESLADDRARIEWNRKHGISRRETYGGL